MSTPVYLLINASGNHRLTTKNTLLHLPGWVLHRIIYTGHETQIDMKALYILNDGTVLPNELMYSTVVVEETIWMKNVRLTGEAVVLMG